MIITASIATAVLLGAGIGAAVTQSRGQFGKRSLSIRRMSVGPGEIVFDIAFLGQWENFHYQKLAKLIANSQTSLEATGFYLHSELRGGPMDPKLVYVLKAAYVEMMNNKPSDYDSSNDPPEVKRFFEAVGKIVEKV